MSSSIKVIKEQNIIDLENIVVQFPSRDGSLFGRKKFTAVNNVSLGIKAGGNHWFSRRVWLREIYLSQRDYWPS